MVRAAIKLFFVILLLVNATRPAHAQEAAPEPEAADAAANGGQAANGDQTAQPEQNVVEAPDPEESRNELLRAYEQEMFLLQAEREKLREALEKVKAEREKRVSSLEKEVNDLATEIETTKSQIGVRRKKLEEVRTENLNMTEGGEAVQGAINQAMLTLDKFGIKAYEPSEDEDELQARLNAVAYVFDQAVKELEELGEIRVEPGTFYLLNKQQVEGKIAHVGRIAALGASDHGSGRLAPAGNGELMLWDRETADAAQTVVNGGQPEILPVYIYEKLTTAAKRREGKTLAQTMEAGGVIGWVIVGLGAVGALMLLMRVLFLWRNSSNTSWLVERVTPLVREGRREEALEVVGRVNGSAARVLKSTIKHLDVEPAQLEDIISENILHETPTLDKFGSSILVIAAVAPLLGLLGTVTGMISTFDIITVYGTGDPKLLSGGISEALVTTEFGLIVAIPTLLLGNLLGAWAERIKLGMENVALRITNVYKGFRPEDLTGSMEAVQVEAPAPQHAQADEAAAGQEQVVSEPQQATETYTHAQSDPSGHDDQPAQTPRQDDQGA